MFTKERHVERGDENVTFVSLNQVRDKKLTRVSRSSNGFRINYRKRASVASAV